MVSRAIILAAGRGTRLGTETSVLPKCLLPLGHETFLSRLLRQYREAGLTTITVVTGYRATMVAGALANDPDVQIIENRLFDATNNMFSLALALSQDSENVVFGNADVVYEDGLLTRFVHDAPHDSIPVHVGAYLDESMKVQRDATGRITRIAKDVPRETALGNSLDVYKLSGASTTALRRLILDNYLSRGRLTEWSEVALNELLTIRLFSPWDIQGRGWYEVDTPADIAEARRLLERKAVKQPGRA